MDSLAYTKVLTSHKVLTIHWCIAEEENSKNSFQIWTTFSEVNQAIMAYVLAG